MPLDLSKLQVSSDINNMEVDVTVRNKELCCDGRITMMDCEVERRATMLVLQIDVTASSNELLRDGLKPIFGRDVERCQSKLVLKIDATARSNDLLRNGIVCSLQVVM